MKIIPLADKILLRRAIAPSKTQGGLVLPEISKDWPCEGEVLAVGSGKRLENGERCKIDVVPGNVVLFQPYAGVEVEVNREKYLIISESDILAIKE